MSNQRTDSFLLPQAVEWAASRHGELSYAEWPKSRDLSQGFEQITFSQLANVVNGVASFLEETLGRSQTAEVIMYLGPNIPYTTAAFVGFMKAGFEIFLASERNSVPAQLHLLEQLNCNILVTPDVQFAPVKAIMAAAPSLTVIELPAWSDITSMPHQPYPFHKTSAANGRDIAFVVHTSGTTGLPKPVKIPFEAVSRMTCCLTLPNFEGYQTIWSLLRDKRAVDLLPLNHPAGINIGVLNAVYNQFTIILPPHGMPPTAETLSDMLNSVDADWCAMAPATLETLSKNASLTQNVTCKVSMLLFSGGSLPKVFGDVLSSKVKLLSSLGSSETGPLTTLYRDDFDWASDWNYLEFHPQINVDFDMNSDGTAELIIRRTQESEPYQAVFVANSSADEYRSKDLFVEHASVPGLWTHVSRSDDVIVLLNGEKVNPIAFESLVTKHRSVSSVIMFGEKRFETGLLVEAAGTAPVTLTEKAALIEDIWPAISEANHQLPDYARVAKDHILFVTVDEPMMRTLKNSIRRQPTLDLYKDGIDKLYRDAEAMSLPESGILQIQAGEAEKAIIKILRSDHRFTKLQVDEDFFAAGMNSLQVVQLVRHIRQALAIPDVDPSLVYTNATAASLSQRLEELSSQRATVKGKTKDKKNRALAGVVDELWHDLSSRLQHPDNSHNDLRDIRNKPSESSQGYTVVLTGSTGSIGRYVLAELISNPLVSRIYCLNRSSESQQLQRTRNIAADSTLPTEFDPERVVFCRTDTSPHDTLGLESELYQEICLIATHIVHVAWPVDFNKPLQSFRPVLQTFLDLLTLQNRTKHNANFMFVSSIASTMASQTTVTEATTTDPSVCPGVGYSESKWIAEALVARAAEFLPASRFSIIRLGQICGSSKARGGWNVTDWVPALILSSTNMGMIPDRLQSGPDTEASGIRWVPVDTGASIICELLLGSQLHEPGSVCVYQPLNKHSTSWEEVLPAIIASALVDKNSPCYGKTFEVVSPARWLEALRKSAYSESEQERDVESLIKRSPALKLLTYFEGRFGAMRTASVRPALDTCTWESDKAMAASQALRAAGAITGKDMQRWMSHWFSAISCGN